MHMKWVPIVYTVQDMWTESIEEVAKVRQVKVDTRSDMPFTGHC
jgi:hypothetical protein